MKASVIVPVYNGENTIRRCIDSVLAQTFRDFELIVVDDGSTDQTAACCAAYTDPRLRLLRQENGGASEARNTGLRAATGDIVCFIDGDDWVEPTYLAELLSPFADPEVSMTVCGFVRDDAERSVPARIRREYLGKRKASEALRAMLLPDGLEGYLWNKAFRRSILEAQSLWLDRDISICEDVKFVAAYLLTADCVLISEKCLYHYIQSIESARSQTIYAPRFQEKWLSEVQAWSDIERMLSFDPEMCEIARGRLALAATMYLKKMLRCNYDDAEKRREMLRLLRANLRYAIKWRVGTVRWRFSAGVCAVSPRLAARL